MDTTEQRILEATIAVIEEVGYDNATVRRIAAKAGVNIAAVNYYYRSKEQLLDKVIAVTLANTFDWGELMHTEVLPPKEQLLSIMDHLANNAQSFPATTRAHFYETIMYGRSDTPAATALSGFMETVFFKLKEKGLHMSDSALRTSITQLFMVGLFSVGVMPQVYEGFQGTDLTKDGPRRKFLQHLIDRLFDA